MTNEDDILSEAGEFAALLPWYVSGKISAADKARVEAYLAAHPKAQKQLILAREEADEVFSANQSIVPPRDALDKLRASLATSPSARLHAVEASLLDRLGVFLASLSPRKLALAGVAAGLAVALQTATIGALMRTIPGGGYETASGQKDGMTGTFALVAFQPAAPAGTLSAFLSENGYTILEGPKAGGMYRLRISPAILTDAERDALVEKLKARADLISFASAAPAAK